MFRRESQEPTHFAGSMAVSNGLKFNVQFILLLVMISAPFVQPVSADNNGASVELSSISIDDYQQTNDSYIVLEFDLISTDGSTGGTFSGIIYFEVENEAGLITYNQSANFDITEGSVEMISHNFSNLDYGYSSISVSLTGQLSSPNSTHDIYFSRLIQRLIPLNISLASPSSIILESISSQSTLTGNNSISDGDFIQLQIPIINSGDFDWIGNLSLVFESNNSYQNYSQSSVFVSKSTTLIQYFNSTFQVFEGQYNLTIMLSNNSDTFLDDNEIDLQFVVGPPPLPSMELDIFLQTNQLISGELFDFYVVIYNNGSVDYTGILNCKLGLEEISNVSVIVSYQTDENLSMQANARPEKLSCSLSGPRVSEFSTISAELNLELESAMFESAGANAPTALLGPWHVGDEVEFSMLVRNYGDKVGNIRMEISSIQSNYVGEYITLGVNQAGVVSVRAPISESDSETFYWTLYSNDGLITSTQSGDLSIPTNEKQDLSFQIDDIEFDSQSGISITYSISLSEGKNRQVSAALSYDDGGSEFDILLIYLEMQSGTITNNHNLGFVDAQDIILRVIPQNWSASTGFFSVSKSVPSERPVHELSFTLQTNPNRPSENQATTVSISISNTGELTGSDGNLLLMAQDGVLLAEQSTKSLAPGESRVVNFNINWPAGEFVYLSAKWDVSGEIIIAENSFVSTISGADSEQMSIPWSGIFGGIGLALVIILIARMRNTNQTDKPEKKQKVRTKQSPADSYSQEKKEIGCPECSRQLRIPIDYSGSVRCPDCEHSFHTSIEETNEFVKEEPQEKPSDGKKEVSCPDCAQSLRIPDSYTGSVRCPACIAVFKANNSEL